MIRLKWVDIVGKELALRSEPSSLGVGVLTVRVSEAVWGRIILKLQRDILGRLQALVGSGVVERIQFLRDGNEPWEGGEPPVCLGKGCAKSALSPSLRPSSRRLSRLQMRD